MAYFSSGEEWRQFRHSYCSRCANWRESPDFQAVGCPVMDAHACHQSADEESEAATVLGMLIAPGRDGYSPHCLMFVEREGAPLVGQQRLPGLPASKGKENL